MTRRKKQTHGIAYFHFLTIRKENSDMPLVPPAPILFLGFGAQKSGTSWLSNYLKSHPEVLMSPIKEMAFFGNRENVNLDRFKGQLAFQDVVTAFTGRENKPRKKHLNDRIKIHNNFEAYKNFFNELLQDEKAYGEITPSYAFMKLNEMIEVRENFPECRIIFLLRNPVDRLWSQMRFSHTKDTPSELLSNAKQRMVMNAYTKRSDYKSTIEKLTTIFPRDRLHFEFFEHLFTQEAVNGICDFLGVSHHQAQLKTKKNAAFHVKLPTELRMEMIKALKPQYDFVGDFFNHKIPSKWVDDLEAIELS
jgi:hypothetical protein